MMMQMAMQPPMLPEMPEIAQVPKVDWEAKRQELRNKAAAEQEKYAKQRRGLSSTILTDLLDESEGAEMITSVLGGRAGQGIQDLFQKASSVLG